VWVLVVLVAVFSVFGFPFIVLMPVVARDVCTPTRVATAC